MCTECGRDHGHATPCPNNPDCALDEPEMVECEICGEEVPDEECLYGVCDSCLAKAETFENALAYGKSTRTSVKINGFFAWFFKRNEIEEILLREMKSAIANLKEVGFYDSRETFEKDFLRNDSSDFADWLKEREKGGG